MNVSNAISDDIKHFQQAEPEHYFGYTNWRLKICIWRLISSPAKSCFEGKYGSPFKNLRYQCTPKSKILVIDIPKYISLSSLSFFCKKRFLLHKVIRKNDFMNKLSLIESSQQVVMIN